MKKQIIFILGLILLFSQPSQAMKHKSKPAPWVKNAIINGSTSPLSPKSSAMVLFSKTDISFEGEYIVSYTKIAYKILKTTGLSYGKLIVVSNTRSKIFDIKGWRFNDHSLHIESLDKERIKERAYNLSFYDDSKQIIATFKNVEKGDMVAFEYKEKLHRYFKDFSFVFGGNIDTLYKEITIKGKGRIAILNDRNNIVETSGNTYFVKNLSKLKSESYSGPDRDRLPIIMVTYDVSKNSSWESFGVDFINKTKNVMFLDEKTKTDLSKSITTSNKKQLILDTINYVSNNINYVDIEFGVGGFIPRACNFVHQKKYGDCKDMAYYATAILRAKGIKAFPVLARTKGIGKVYPEFVSDQFNHVIMAVELDKETIELKNIDIEGKPYLISDLTDRFTPVPLVSSSIEGTFALVLKDDKSVLVKIPYSSPEKNKLIYDINIDLDCNRTMNVTLTETKTGHFYSSEKQFLENLEATKKSEKYENWVQEFAPASRLKAFSINSNNNCAVTDVSFVSPNIGIESGEDIFFFPNIVDYDKKGYKRKPRTSTIKFKQLYAKEEHIVTKISNFFIIKTVPKSYETDNKFFVGSAIVKQNGNIITISNKIIWKTTVILQQDYKEFRKYYKKFLKSLKSPIILVKK